MILLLVFGGWFALALIAGILIGLAMRTNRADAPPRPDDGGDT